MEKMKNCILAALCGCLFTGARSETTNTVNDAERIIVTATRSPENIRTVPGNPSVITSQDIADGHYASVPEALQKKAGVFFRNYADNPSQAAVDIRGFGGDSPFGKVLVLLNGRKLNRPDMATINWAQIPMQAVERIEVVRGPNSVLYGDHAVSGVINIITKEPSDIPQTTLTASAASYETYEQTLTTSGKLDGLGYVATAGHQSGDGYRDRSTYDTASGSLRLSGNINEQLSAYAEASVVKEQHQLPGSLTAAQVQQNRRQATDPDNAAREKYFTAQAGFKALLTDNLIFNLDGGLSRKDLEVDNASWVTYSDNMIDTYTLSPKFTILSPVAALENELVFGIDLTEETFKLKKYADKARTIQTTDTKITKDVVGGYFADTLHLTDKLFLSGGFRMEENEVSARHTDALSPYKESKTHTEEVWQTALTWLPTDVFKLFTGVGRTYRYPFIDEQASYWGYGADFFNKDLKPETGINYEIGAEFTPRTNLVLRATAFRTGMKDEIAPNAFYVNENLDKTTHSGIELSAGYKNDYFAMDAYYTWLQSEFAAGDNRGNEMPWVPKNKLDVNLAFFLTDALTLSTHMGYVGNMYAAGDNANTGADKQSDYALVDVLLEYTLPVRACKSTVFAGVDNLFGTEYNYLVYYGGYYPAPERTYKAGLSVKF